MKFALDDYIGMSQSKQEVIDIILSFSYEELKNWIWSRLHGDDDYFSIYEGHETNLSDFLADAFHHIKNKNFRADFLEILGDLVNQLKKYNPKEIEENKEYIYECWMCSCDNTNRKVSKKTVNDFSAVWEPVKKELEKQTCDDCQAMIISGKGFTKTALEAANEQNILLKTYNQLLSDLNTFYSHQKPLIQDLDALIRTSDKR